MIKLHDKQGGSQQVKAVSYMQLALVKVAHAAQTLWEQLASCFGSGFWIRANLWKSNELWKH